MKKDSVQDRVLKRFNAAEKRVSISKEPPVKTDRPKWKVNKLKLSKDEAAITIKKKF